MYLWWWTVRVLRPRPDAAPNGIVTGRAAVQRVEGAARWRGKPGALVEALITMGLVTRANKKMRVKGTEPYAREQRRKERARERERVRRAEKKKLLEQAQQPKKPQLVRTKISEAALAFWNWMMHERAQDVWKAGHDPFGPRAHGIERPGCAPDREPPIGFGKWFDEREAEGISVESLANAWGRFLGDDGFRTKRWPVPVFITEGVYRKRLTA